MDVFIRLLNSLLMILGPLALGIILVRRWKLGWRLFFLGAATFIGSQVLHIPFNQFIVLPYMEKLGLIGNNDVAALVLYGLVLGLSAGVFEEGARYLVYRVWLLDVRRWKEAVLYGAGHGGVEAILLGGLALYAFFQATAYRNANLSELVPPGQLELAKAQIEAYWSAPWYEALIGALERAFAVIIQISLAILVFQAVARRKIFWLFLAVGWHTAVDALAVFGIQRWGVYPTEAVVAGFALISLAMILFLSKQPVVMPEGLEEVDASLLVPDLPAKPRKPDLSKERLENSRYDPDV
jgi:uncharacterized membrane protein YhfC